MAYRRGTQPKDSDNISDEIAAGLEYRESHPLDSMDEWIKDLKLSIASILMKDEEKENPLRKIGGKLPERPSPTIMNMPTPASPRGKK